MCRVEQPAHGKATESLKIKGLEQALATPCNGPAIAVLEAASAGNLPSGARNLGTCGWQKDVLGHACARQEDKDMWLLRRLAVPANESQMAVALAISVVGMSLMLWAIIWQSDVIAYQRDIIHWLWSWKSGG